MGNITLEREQKQFVNESLTPMNEFIAFNCRKLKRKELIHSCYRRNRVSNIEMTDKSQTFKIFHIESLLNLFSDFDFEAGEMQLAMHLRILIPLYIQPTNLKCSSVKWIISGLGFLMMLQETFIRSIMCANTVLLSYFNAANWISSSMDGMMVLLYILRGEINPAETRFLWVLILIRRLNITFVIVNRSHH